MSEQCLGGITKIQNELQMTGNCGEPWPSTFWMDTTHRRVKSVSFNLDSFVSWCHVSKCQNDLETITVKYVSCGVMNTGGE